MSNIKRKTFSSALKAKVALEAVKGVKTLNQIALEHKVHPTQVNVWKKELLANSADLFEGKRGQNQSMHRVILIAATLKLAS